LSAIDDRRVRQLIESASQNFASGRTQDAERFLRQAEAEAPQHPLVLNETARRLLMADDPAGAHEVLVRAVREDPNHPSLWLNLAAALRGLKRYDAELAALEKVLVLEPSNLRALLQKASLFELQGQARAAAGAYRYALQLIPPGAEAPAAMRPVIEHANRAVQANNRELETFLEDRLRDLRAQHAHAPLARFEQCLATLLQKRRVFRQQPSFLYFPQLPAIEFHDRAEFPWLDSIEAATDDIRQELLSVLADGPAMLEPYVAHPQGVPLNQWRDLNNSRRWGVYFLWREGRRYEDHLARCPRTAAALEAWPRWDVPGSGATAVFSILDAKTRIPPHNGVNNTRLIVHLPLVVPPGCGFRVGGEQREWHPGKAFVFDDTIEHEAWNDSDVPRAVLILDIWNPLVSEAEREFVRSVTSGVGEYYGTTADQRSTTI
jgi:aspartate beta-hydroxylase